MGIEISDSFNTMVKVSFLFKKIKNKKYKTELLFKNLKSQISDVVFWDQSVELISSINNYVSRRPSQV